MLETQTHAGLAGQLNPVSVQRRHHGMADPRIAGTRELLVYDLLCRMVAIWYVREIWDCFSTMVLREI